MTARRSIFISMLMGTLLTGVVAFPAVAAPSGSSSTRTYVVNDCVSQVKAAIVAGQANGTTVDDCQVTTGVTIGSTFVVTKSQILADSTLSSAEKSSMLAASATSAITGKHWSQFTTGAAYTRTQNGTFYYNGSRVWVTVTYSGYTGSHSCFTNYSVGFNLTGGSCSESGSTTQRNLYSDWDVNPNGTPIHYNVSMTANVFSNGTGTGV